MKQKYFLLLFVNLLFVKCVVFHNYNPKPTDVEFIDNVGSSKSILVNIILDLRKNSERNLPKL